MQKYINKHFHLKMLQRVLRFSAEWYCEIVTGKY